MKLSERARTIKATKASQQMNAGNKKIILDMALKIEELESRIKDKKPKK